MEFSLEVFFTRGMMIPKQLCLITLHAPIFGFVDIQLNSFNEKYSIIVLHV